MNGHFLESFLPLLPIRRSGPVSMLKSKQPCSKYVGLVSCFFIGASRFSRCTIYVRRPHVVRSVNTGLSKCRCVWEMNGHFLESFLPLLSIHQSGPVSMLKSNQPCSKYVGLVNCFFIGASRFLRFTIYVRRPHVVRSVKTDLSKFRCVWEMNGHFLESFLPLLPIRRSSPVSMLLLACTYSRGYSD